MRLWQAVVAAWVIGCSTLAAAEVKEDSAEQWLQTMLASSRDSSFSGYSVLVSAGQMVSLAVYHAPIDGEVWERVVHMNGEPAEIIRQGSTIDCLHPSQSTGMAFKSPVRRWSALEQGMQSLSRYYGFDRAGNARVAGRQTVRLNLTPLDSHRYGYSLWLDAETGVLLRSQTLPQSGEPLEMFEFVSVNMGQPLTKADFAPGEGLVHSPQASADDIDKAQPARHWVPGWLPEGFVESERVARFSGQGRVTTRAYTDGLASFTVFHEPRQAAVLDTASAHGSTVAVHRSIPGAMITVVGEIPLATAERIAASVKPLAP